MKKLGFLLAIALLFGLAACGQAGRSKVVREEPCFSCCYTDPLIKTIFENLPCSADYAIMVGRESGLINGLQGLGIAADSQIQALYITGRIWEYALTDSTGQVWHLSSFSDLPQSVTIRKDGPHGEIIFRPYYDRDDVGLIVRNWISRKGPLWLSLRAWRMKDKLTYLIPLDPAGSDSMARMLYRLGIDGAARIQRDIIEAPHPAFESEWHWVSSITDHSGQAFHITARYDNYDFIVRKNGPTGEIMYQQW